MIGRRSLELLSYVVELRMWDVCGRNEGEVKIKPRRYTFAQIISTHYIFIFIHFPYSHT